jgi:hypothetical protein
VSVLFEVAGLGTVAWQLGRVQRREFGTPAWIIRVRQWWRRLRGAQPLSQHVNLRWASESDKAMPPSVRKSAAPNAPIEQRLSALEHNVAALDEETGRQFRARDERQGQLQKQINSLGAELRGQHDERERERREQLRESMAWQWIGTGLFLLGAILAGVANGAC